MKKKKNPEPTCILFRRFVVKIFFFLFISVLLKFSPLASFMQAKINFFFLCTLLVHSHLCAENEINDGTRHEWIFFMLIWKKMKKNWQHRKTNCNNNNDGMAPFLRLSLYYLHNIEQIAWCFLLIEYSASVFVCFFFLLFSGWLTG